MSVLSEFKEFAVKGNAMDMAVGIIIGAGFQKVVDSLVNDILMPPIGMLLGNVDFTNLYIALDGSTHANFAAAQEAGIPTVNYGLFINSVVEFTIVAFAVFLLVRQLNKLRRNEVNQS